MTWIADSRSIAPVKQKSKKFLRPLSIVFAKEYVSIEEARAMERLLKKKKSRAIIEQIITQGNMTLKGPIV